MGRVGRYAIAGKHFTIPPSVMSTSKFFSRLFSLEKSEKSRLEMYFFFSFFPFGWAAHPRTTAGFVGCCCDLNEPSAHSRVTPASRFPALRSTSAARVNSTSFPFFLFPIDRHLEELSRSFLSNSFFEWKNNNTYTLGNLDPNLQLHLKSFPFSCREIATLGNKNESWKKRKEKETLSSHFHIRKGRAGDTIFGWW